MRGLKIQKFFQKYKLHEEKELFDFLLEVGGQYRTLQWMLWFWASENALSFWVDQRSIIGYCRREGLYEKRKLALASKPRRKMEYKPTKKGWNTSEYRSLIRRK